jgi:thioredoxin reductase (NADPH)
MIFSLINFASIYKTVSAYCKKEKPEIKEYKYMIIKSDVLIIGGGPGGISAAVYLKRLGISVKIIQTLVGGQVLNTGKIDNFIGEANLTGEQLGRNLDEQEHKILSNNEIFEDYIDEINYKNNQFESIGDNKYVSNYLILATGANPKKLGIPGEVDYAGRGVSYCAICDGAFFKDKDIIVVGGGDSAFSEARLLTKFAKKVSIMYRKASPRAQKIEIIENQQNKKIELINNTIIKKIIGDSNGVNSVITQKNGIEHKVNTSGVFIYVGITPNLPKINFNLAHDEMNFIYSDEYGQTNVPNLFVVGDLKHDSFRQISIAIADGANSALKISSLKNKKGK